MQQNGTNKYDDNNFNITLFSWNGQGERVTAILKVVTVLWTQLSAHISVTNESILDPFISFRQMKCTIPENYCASSAKTVVTMLIGFSSEMILVQILPTYRW